MIGAADTLIFLAVYGVSLTAGMLVYVAQPYTHAGSLLHGYVSTYINPHSRLVSSFHLPASQRSRPNRKQHLSHAMSITRLSSHPGVQEGRNATPVSAEQPSTLRLPTELQACVFHELPDL